MEQAIKKAIEGGWRQREYPDYDVIEVNAVGVVLNCHGLMGDFEYTFYREKLLLDPKWWQALGKALGWQEVALSGYIVNAEVFGKPTQLKISSHGEWQAHWHRFIDHLASGKDADSFFQELLSPKN